MHGGLIDSTASIWSYCSRPDSQPWQAATRAFSPEATKGAMRALWVSQREDLTADAKRVNLLGSMRRMWPKEVEIAS